MIDDIRIERGAEVRPGVFAWRSAALALSGSSRQPLLDTCRAIKRMGGDPRRRVAMFREGRSTWDKRCSVEWGASHRVSDEADGIRFARFDPEAFARFKQAAE